MSWRKWVSFVALAGVLLHAGAIARHNAYVLAAALNLSETLAASAAGGSAIICGVLAGTGAADAPVGHPDRPAAPAQRCPICAGLVSADALPAVEAAAPPFPKPAAIRATTLTAQDAPSPDRLLPSGRAPPLTV